MEALPLLSLTNGSTCFMMASHELKASSDSSESDDHFPSQSEDQIKEVEEWLSGSRKSS